MRRWSVLVFACVLAGTVPAEAGTAAVEARVVDPGGEPVAGVRVWLHTRGEGAPIPPGGFEPPELETDAEGLIRFGGLEAGERIALRLEHPNYVHEYLQAIEAPTAEPLEIFLRPGAAVSGIVVTGDGEGIAGAFVEAKIRASTETPFGVSRQNLRKSKNAGAGGRFELRGLHPGEVELSASRGGFAERTLRLPLAGGERREGVRLELLPAANVSGRVLDSPGRPVAGCKVSFRGEDGSWRVTTDDQGRFRIKNRAAGPAKVTVRHREHGAAETEVELVPGDNPIELTLAPGRQVAGRVVDAFGQPVSGAWVELAWRSESPGYTADRARTGDDGIFSLEPKRTGTYEVTAEVDDLMSASLALTAGEKPIRGLELVLLPGSAITGAVLEIPSEDRGRVKIRARHSTDPGRGRSVAVDARGNYRIAGLHPGTWRIEASVPGSGHGTSATVEVLAGESEVVQDLELSGGDLRLIGVVVSGGAPVARVKVSLAGSSAWTTTSREGRFRLEGLEPGTHVLRISGNWGYHEEALELWSDHDLTVTLEPTELRVIVPALADSPEPASLIVFDSAGQLFRPARVGLKGDHWTIERGEAVLRRLPPGTWGIWVIATGQADWRGVATTRVGRPAEVVLRR